MIIHPTPCELRLCGNLHVAVKTAVIDRTALHLNKMIPRTVIQHGQVAFIPTLGPDSGRISYKRNAGGAQLLFQCYLTRKTSYRHVPYAEITFPKDCVYYNLRFQARRPACQRQQFVVVRGIDGRKIGVVQIHAKEIEAVYIATAGSI